MLQKQSSTEDMMSKHELILSVSTIRINGSVTSYCRKSIEITLKQKTDLFLQILETHL